MRRGQGKAAALGQGRLSSSVARRSCRASQYGYACAYACMLTCLRLCAGIKLLWFRDNLPLADGATLPPTQQQAVIDEYARTEVRRHMHT
jgi:hypothetical protein